ncbi:MAG: glycosyltransferase family 2 protein [Sedimentisphaerales bacterium]|nr:glycosyltransferase family 2 protein [Sedimentisphaerales bacterium]
MTIDRASPNRTDSAMPKAVSITVFFPCCNEEDNIERTVKKAIIVLDRLEADYEIIIVNDGSSDNTASVAQRLAAENNAVKVVHHAKNLGYGAALRSGFDAATKNLIFYTDGDGQFDFEEMPPILPLIEKCDIVSCYRLKRAEGIVRRINAWCWTKLVCLLFGLKLRDIDCAFKLYKAEIFQNIRLSSTGALIDAEILARAAAKGYRIAQAPVHHFPRIAGRQTGANMNVILRAFKELFKLYRIIKSEK